ncbi:hypothetical protein [Metabacillus litoralis]|uniref:hypothetical protein n=1 Tax=Metabacillus litoralis TaxID=152268 RepID=UPI001CFDF0A7|nr:hypothetical protein [Metabacillus litoralis]
MLIKNETNPLYDKINVLSKRVKSLESYIASLEKLMQILMHQEDTKEDSMRTREGQPVIFQEITVEKLFMDKYEQTNNLGQVGIKELSGHLNIGATYEKGLIPSELIEEWKTDLNQMKEEQKEQKEDQDEHFHNDNQCSEREKDHIVSDENTS